MGRVDHRRWWERAACAGAPTTLFIQPENHNRQRQWANTALGYCKLCEVTEQCYQAALQEGDFISVRGGTTPKERKQACQSHTSTSSTETSHQNDGESSSTGSVVLRKTRKSS